MTFLTQIMSFQVVPMQHNRYHKINKTNKKQIVTEKKHTWHCHCYIYGN